MEFSVPEMIDTRYRVKEKIGSGAMANVYSAEDTRLGRSVALKILDPAHAADETFRARFQQEAESVASLNHPAIVSVYDTGTFSSGSVQVPFMVMELVGGKSLREILDARGELPVDEALSYGSQILEALQYAGDRGVVHRDIKPANVMILPQTEEDASQGRAGQVKVMDFGIASAMTESGEALAGEKTVMGTARYVSPEQARGETVDSRSDIYSAACVIYEMISGHSPFDADSTEELVSKHLSEAPQPPSAFSQQQIPAALDTVLLKALSKSRASRYQNADAFRTALAGAASSHGAGSTAASSYDDTATVPTTALGAGALAAGAAAGAGATAGYTTSSQPAPTEETGLGSFFDNAEAEYSDDELYDYERNEALAKKKRRRAAWTKVITGMVIAALALFSIGTVLYYQNELNKVPTHEVPALQGVNREEAENTLRNMNLSVKWEEEFSDDVEKDNVIKTSPVTGTEVEEGSEVTVTLSDGPSRVAVPDNLEGQSESYVRSALEEAGFKAGRTSNVNSATVPAGMVVNTTPAAGEQADAGSTVDIILSTGKVEVPDVTGMTRDQAIAALQAPEVMLSTNIETVQTSGQPAGTVISQSSAPGTSIEQGSTVTIRVAAAPAPTAAPNNPNSNNNSNQGNNGNSNPGNSGSNNGTGSSENEPSSAPSSSAAPSAPASASAQPSASASARG